MHCVREVKGGQIEMMSDNKCKGTVPEKYEKCSVKKVCPEWKSDEWSSVCPCFFLCSLAFILNYILKEV